MELDKMRNAAESYVVKVSDIQRRPLSRLEIDWSDLEAAFMAGVKWRDAQGETQSRETAVVPR